jgi:hypothetical protein
MAIFVVIDIFMVLVEKYSNYFFIFIIQKDL